MSERPFLTVTDPVAVTYGGAPGLQVDIVVATRPCLSDWSFILPFNPGINGGNGSQLTGTELRLIAQTVGDETIVALTEDLTGLELSGMQSDTGVASLPLATGQPDEPGLLAAPVQGAGTSFVDVAQEVVETFEWELTSAPPQLPNTAVPADGLSRSRGLRPSDAAAVVFGAVLIVLVGLQRASFGANAPQKDQPITPMTR